MIRRSFQKGHISKRRTQHGVVYDIRYRVRKAEGGWRLLCKTLHDLGDGRAGRDKAEEMLRARLREAHGASRFALPSRMKLQQFIDNQWRQYLDRKAVKPSTRASYQAYLGKHIMPGIGDLEIAEITPFHIGELLAKKGSEGLAARSVHHMYRLLDTIFRLAVDNDLVHRSPVRKHHRPQYARASKVAWTPEQFRRLLAQIPPAYQALVATVALLGARIGEILGLQWEHVNFSSGEITISQSLWRGKLQTTKTENSVRIMPMSDFLLTTLLRDKRESVHNEPDNYVLPWGRQTF